MLSTGGRAGRATLRRWTRGYRLEASKAEELIRRVSAHLRLQLKAQNIPASSSNASQPAGSGFVARIYASRRTNTPTLSVRNADQPESTAVEISLDITSETLPSTDLQSLGDLGGDGASGTMAALEGLWRTWRENDLLRLETKIGGESSSLTLSNTAALFDPFAAHRHPSMPSLADPADVHPLETLAAASNLFYHKSRTGGNIGCYGYGAGSAMSTMDVLAKVGGRPTNFLDGGGGATEANVQAALGLLMQDPDVEVVFVNSFGGLTRTEMIAEGLVRFLRERKAQGKTWPPFVVRLRGTGEAEAKRILEEAKDLDNVQAIPDLKAAATEASRLASAQSQAPVGDASIQPVAKLSPVVFSRDGQYEQTAKNIMVKEGTGVVVMGTGKASQFHNSIAQKYGTNIIGATAPGKGGQTFLSRPVLSSLREAKRQLRPDVVSVFVPARNAADAILECIEEEIPLIVAYAEGVPMHDQLRVQAALRSQGKSRLIGANCPGMIIPHAKIKLGIQPLAVHSPGCVGLASRSGTISYELAAQTTALGFGQSIVFGLGGDPFPGTRTAEALSLMLADSHTKVVCVIGEVGGQMEEEVAEVYSSYLANLSAGEAPKPVVGFVAGLSTVRGKMYGHAGAVWYDDTESAASKKRTWQDAGIIVVDTLGEYYPQVDLFPEGVDPWQKVW